MTRFARAKGSKASNERVPEEATSWQEMKQQLLAKDKGVEEARKKQEADKQREKNYRAFLETVEEEKSKNSEWAEFPADKPKEKKKVEQNNNQTPEVPKKKKKKKVQTAGEVRQKSETNISKHEGEVDTVKTKPPQASTGAKNSKKRKFNDGESATKKRKLDAHPNKKKPENLSEEDLKKIEKKKQKKMRQTEKRKQFQPPPSKRENKVHKRRKDLVEKMFINGNMVEIAYVDGFPVKKEDAERLHGLRKQMISKGLPRSEIKIALKLERRKAEKAFAREKKKVCFNCRKSGHNLSECPELGQQQLAESAGTGICFKCGSTEHTHFECKVVRGQEFKFAQCFICHEQGHIARQCPDNARGLYPKGGACNVCGDVTHLKKDCPKYQAQQRQLEQSIHLETMEGGGNPDNLTKGDDFVKINQPKRLNKIIKF